VLVDQTEAAQPVLEVASRDVVSVSPDDSAMVALNVMIDEQIEHVPVLDDDQLVGICTRTDLLKVREDQREHERRQQGIDFGGMRRVFARRNGERSEASP
jgi:signal-transduction protein with cAMP-binding, CBS, and nucleotidyltransferase domain